MKHDISGQRFNNLTAIKYMGYSNWLCRCDCGNERIVTYYRLVSGITKSCNECNNNNKLIDITGLKFGRWTVKKYAGDRKWVCTCECSPNIEHIVSGYDLRYNKTTSCIKCKGKSLEEINLPKILKKKEAKNIELIGNKFGEWEVISLCSNKDYVKCRCSCGEIRDVLVRSLKENKSKFCGSRSKHNIKNYNFKDITGKTFGKLTAIEYYGDGYWLCRCTCGREDIFLGKSLINGHTKSCGHSTIIEYIGNKYNKLTILEHLENKYVLCQCDCGNKTIALVNNVVRGTTKSCGCLNKAKKYDKDEVIECVNTFIKNYGIKPSLSELALELDVAIPTVRKYINDNNLNNYINYYFSSRYEAEIYHMFNNAILHDKTVLQGLELDIYIPDKKLAIEFNGNYWHSTIYKDKYYHQQKTIACAKQGIHLIHIFEHEWKDDRTKEIIKDLLINNRIKVGARNTYIKEIDINESHNFLEQYHLQGDTGASIRLGCFNKESNELLGIMTLGKPRFNNNYEYEIIRLCWKHNIRVIGGLEKFMSYFIKSYKPKSILTYIDISKFTGNSYIKAGFKPCSNPITEPNYFWSNKLGSSVLSRYATMKSKLVSSGLGTQDQTEDEIMANLGYIKVYNSGNLVLEWICQ